MKTIAKKTGKTLIKKSIQQKYLIVGNWKNQVSSPIVAKKLFTGINKTAEKSKTIETVICPPMIYTGALGDLVTSRNCVIGTQGILTPSSVVRTGSITPEMVFNSKSRYVIVGHSEERATGITDIDIADAVSFIVQYPLIPIICVGEHNRDKNHTYYAYIANQITIALSKLSLDEIARIVIAYEPVWAIGNNAKRPCTTDECAMMVRHIRKTVLDITQNSDIAMNIRILYGGSVHADNARDYINIGEASGLLVGRASLDIKEFTEILKKLEK